MPFFRFDQDHDEVDTFPTNLDNWRNCGQNLVRLATHHKKPVPGDPWQQHQRPTGNNRRHSVGEMSLVRGGGGVGREDRKFAVSDLLTVVTLAGAYYCLNKIKSILV